MSTAYCVVLCTCPNRDSARRIAGALVEAGLAACVNIIPGVESIYRWKCEAQMDQELLLTIKTRSDAFPALQAAIQENHPYELPEIIAVPIEHGLPDYLAWIENSLTPSNRSGNDA